MKNEREMKRWGKERGNKERNKCNLHKEGGVETPLCVNVSKRFITTVRGRWSTAAEDQSASVELGQFGGS